MCLCEPTWKLHPDTVTGLEITFVLVIDGSDPHEKHARPLLTAADAVEIMIVKTIVKARISTDNLFVFFIFSSSM